jgi:uncharacterized protein with HXXEE motif
VAFTDAVLLFPVAVLLHVVDEWPGFPRWARRFASPQYSDREYLAIHKGAVMFAVGCAALVRAFPSSWMVFGFFAIAFFPAILCNAMFHIGATALTRTLCPGVVTSVLVYLPLATFIVDGALRQAALPPVILVVAAVFATAFHVIEVGHNVFKRW